MFAAASEPASQPLLLTAQDNAPVLASIALLTLAFIGCASLFKTASLRSGGSAVARSLGGAPVPKQVADPRLQRLRNVVEEVAIASGVPVPQIYWLEQEVGINAFAAGWSPSDAAVCVTRGTLEKLSRDELQGVVAHEFSHILNGDMRLNIRLTGVLFGLLLMGGIGRALLDGAGRSRSRDSGPFVLLGLGLMGLGYLGLFSGRLIKAGVSRRREFLADASAVQFTRQSSGIAGALKKIAGIDAGSRLAVDSEEVSHMLFGDGIGYSRLFATHPPLLERIRKLEPRFDVASLRRVAAAWNSHDYVPDDLAPAATGFAPPTQNWSPARVIAQVAQPSADDYRHAEWLHGQIPWSLEQAAEAQPLATVFALLLDRDETIRKSQQEEIARRFGERTAQEAEALLTPMEGLHPGARLPLAALCFPALRSLPSELLTRLSESLSVLINADGRVALFEACLSTLLRVQIADALHPARSQALGRRRLGDCAPAAQTLLALLAAQGHPEYRLAQQAYQFGADHLFPRSASRYALPSNGPQALAAALFVLDALDGPGKQLLIEALVKTLNHDRRVTVGEAELLRAICGALHCSLPPHL